MQTLHSELAIGSIWDIARHLSRLWDIAVFFRDQLMNEGSLRTRDSSVRLICCIVVLHMFMDLVPSHLNEMNQSFLMQKHHTTPNAVMLWWIHEALWVSWSQIHYMIHEEYTVICHCNMNYHSTVIVHGMKYRSVLKNAPLYSSAVYLSTCKLISNRKI